MDISYKLPNDEPTVRMFQVLTGASVADPEHQIAMAETTSGTSVCYTNYDTLKDLIHNIELQDAYNAGIGKGMNEVLTVLGMSFQEFFKVKDAKACESSKK